MTEKTDMPVTIHAQYVKDLSFENPNAPDSLRGGQSQPKIDVQINLDVREVKSEKVDNLYEVLLNAKGEAKREDGDVVFIVEVFYGVLVEIGKEVDQDKIHPLLMIEIPKMAFPFVRKIVNDSVMDGGFPSFMITPVDFNALYMQRFAGDEDNKTVH